MEYYFLKILYFAPPLLLAVICHEVAHGWVAEKLGDPTARKMGRITLNPIVHIDLWMTILVPALLILLHSPFIFGGAKPVPVNPLNFRNPRRGMAYVAMAGPIVNFSLVLVLWPIFKFLSQRYETSEHPGFFLTLLAIWALHSILINLVLGLFNLFPIPPLDGGRIAVGFLPISVARKIARIEPFGLMIVIFLLASGVLAKVLDPVLDFFALNLMK